MKHQQTQHTTERRKKHWFFFRNANTNGGCSVCLFACVWRNLPLYWKIAVFRWLLNEFGDVHEHNELLNSVERHTRNDKVANTFYVRFFGPSNDIKYIRIQEFILCYKLMKTQPFFLFVQYNNTELSLSRMDIAWKSVIRLVISRGLKKTVTIWIFKFYKIKKNTNYLILKK